MASFGLRKLHLARVPVCILVLRRRKQPDDVLFSNAAEHCEKVNRQPQLSEENITKLVATYQNRMEARR